MWPELRHSRKQEVKLRAKTPSTTKTRNVERSNLSQNYGGKFSKIFSNETRAISGTPFDEDRQCVTIICRGRWGEDNSSEKTSPQEKLQQSSLGQTEKGNCKARNRRRGEKRASVFGLCVKTGRFCAHMFLKFHLICCIF